MRAFVVFVPIESPDAADHDQATDPIVPEIANVMKAQVGAGVGAFESDVIVKHELRQMADLGHGHNFLARATGVVAERSELPFHVDDAAVVGRKFCFGYLSHKWEMFDDDLNNL